MNFSCLFNKIDNVFKEKKYKERGQNAGEKG